MKIKIFSALVFLTISLFFVENSFAQSLSDFSFPLSLKASIAGLNPYTGLPPEFNPEPSITTVLCEIRCQLAGKVGLTLVAVTIFINGLLVLNRKMSWQKAALTCILITVMVGAETIAGYVMKTSIFGTMFAFISDYSCNCVDISAVIPPKILDPVTLLPIIP